MLDLVGQKYGLLTVQRFADQRRTPTGRTRVRWLCLCDCGNVTVVAGNDLRHAHTRSCGCQSSNRTIGQRSYKHGHTPRSGFSREYRIWRNVLNRCYNPKLPAYKNYGGRGITVCERWRTDFAPFFADMGTCPPKHSIDRIDNDGPYEPKNCRWATRAEQANNRRGNVRADFDGRSLTAAQLSKELGIPDYTIERRLKAGDSIARIIERSHRRA